MEIGCGRGLAALTAARTGARFVAATDRNPSALRALARRAQDEGLPLVAIRTDLAQGLRTFDRILSNPPYLPTPPAARDPDPWENLALDGGPDGCTVTARILAALPAHLSPGGRAYLLVSSQQSRSRLGTLLSAWRRRGGRQRTVARERWGEERLEVWELTRSPHRGEPARPRNGSRRRNPRRGRPASSRDAGCGRTNARDAA